MNNSTKILGLLTAAAIASPALAIAFDTPPSSPTSFSDLPPVVVLPGSDADQHPPLFRERHPTDPVDPPSDP